MNDFTKDELCDVITHTASALKTLADGMDTFNDVLKEILFALNAMNNNMKKLTDE